MVSAVAFEGSQTDAVEVEATVLVSAAVDSATDGAVAVAGALETDVAAY